MGFVTQSGRATAGLKRLLVPAAIAAACLGAVDAKATVVMGTFSGVVAAGDDFAGVFGPANSNLRGLRYVETFTYDTSKGVRVGDATSDRIYATGHQEPVLTYSLTINGITESFVLNSGSSVEANENYFQVNGLGGGGIISVYDIAYGNSFSNLDHPVSFLDNIDGAIEISPAYALKDNESGGEAYYVAFDTQRVDFLIDGVSSGAPEPAAWALMLTGFLAVGGTFRSKLRKGRALQAERSSRKMQAA